MHFGKVILSTTLILTGKVDIRCRTVMKGMEALHLAMLLLLAHPCNLAAQSPR
jgi:hypothetical protein